jgi:hypothetical protein
MPIGSKHTALCSADVHSNQTEICAQRESRGSRIGQGSDRHSSKIGSNT